MQARKRIARPTLDARLVVAVSREPGKSAHLFHRLGESRVIAPRPVQAKCGHPHEDRVGVDLRDRLPVQAKALHHPGRKIFDHDVRTANQLLGDVDALGPRQVQRDAPLVRIRSEEEGALLPPLVAVVESPAGHSHAVRALDRFDVDDLRSERRQHVTGRRPRPPSRRIKDPESRQRKFGRTVFP